MPQEHPPIPATTGEAIANRVTEAAAEAMRAAIAESGGNEVFFAGSLDGGGKVASVRAVARGHQGAVPAFFEAVGTREVVIHNHPSGNLAPSDADLGLASVFGRHGHGFYIINNDASRAYVVVEPQLQRQIKKINGEALAASLQPASRLAKTLPGFEVRPQQAEMMAAVARAFNDDGIAVIEAPTGVGKTLAYLIPAIAWALENKERVVISTRTINLQEQIIEKDIPTLQHAASKEFSACLVKGRGNYLCLRKLQRIHSEASLLDDEGETAVLNRISAWAEKTEDGSLADLPFVPPRELWSRICSEADTCSFANCPNPNKCHVGRARREMAKADLLVVNHHMLFSDIAIKKESGRFSSIAVLPAYQRVILDEAHNVEDAATEYFGMEVTRNGAMALLGRFVRTDRGRERGLLPYLKVKIMGDGDHLATSEVDKIFDLIDQKLMPSIVACRQALETAFTRIREYTSEHCGKLGGSVQWRLTEEVLAEPGLRSLHNSVVMPAVEELQRCVGLTGRVVVMVKDLPAKRDGEDAPWQGEVNELDSYRIRLQRLVNGLAEGTSKELAENTVRWIEIVQGNKNIVRIARCPLNVSDAMADTVYPNLRSLVMASATLSVGGKFDFLFNRLGLDQVEHRDVNAIELESPFDFQEQALLGVVTDLPAPEEPGFLNACVDHCGEILSITQGHAFVLFTSFYALDYLYNRLEKKLNALGITALKQGQMPRNELIARFRSDTSSVLFGTDSFWEGVDVAGDSLQCVILPRLPFRVPTEPIQEARVESIDEAGGNAFMEYTVPQAVIKFRQGFGRLIRRRTDRGAVVVLDKRIVTKRYGRVFLESLPGVRTVKGPHKGVYMALQKFFQPEGDGHDQTDQT